MHIITYDAIKSIYPIVITYDAVGFLIPLFGAYGKTRRAGRSGS